MDGSFADRNVVVTGGTGALGAAVVAQFVDAGAICHLPVHGPAAPAQFPWRDHPKVKITPGLDLSDQAAVDAFYESVPRLWASVHAAGGFAAGAIADTGKDALMQQIDINLVTAFLCSRAAVIAMCLSGGGRIVNVASRNALEWRLGAGVTAYAASKAAIAALTVALAEEVAKDGILVNAVAPSIIDTPANRSAMPKADFAAWPRPEEIARTILHLASPENGVTRGAVVPVYGKS